MTHRQFAALCSTPPRGSDVDPASALGRRRRTMHGLPLVVFAVALLAGTLAAGACGQGYLTALLFRTYPEAQRVYDAEFIAARAGLLDAGRVAPTTPRPPRDAAALHAWRAARVAELAARLDARLRLVANPLARSAKAHLFLIHEFRWLELTAAADGLRLSPMAAFPSDDGVRIFTTERVLTSVLHGRLDWSTAVRKNLIVARGPKEQSAPWLSALRDAARRSNTSARPAP